MNNMIEKAVRLNNEGVNQLLNGHYKEAEQSLRQNIAPPSPESKLSNAGVCNEETLPHNKGSDDQLRKEDFIHSFHPLPFLQGDNNFIYSNVISLRNVNFKVETKSLNDIYCMYCTCMTLNIALICHCRANLNNGRYNSYHKKAESLYGLVQTLAESENDGSRLSSDDIYCLLMMAAANNKSLLQFEGGNYQHARESLTFIATILYSFDIEKKSTKVLLGQDEIKGFLSNVVVLLSAGLNVAPAA